MSNKSESVRVCVRIRPLSTKEKQDGHDYVVFADARTGEISLNDPEADAREPPKKFTFDAAIPPESSQMEVYTKAATDIVDSVVNGFNGTIFAYGQTGAGKSHTMEGYSDQPEQQGIIPNSFKHIFGRIADESKDKQFMVYASYLEIYNEEIRDLLGQDPKNRLELKENLETGIYVKDLTSRQVTGVAEIDAVMQQGKKNRSVGATLMNQTSSRSHSMFTITVEACSKGVDGKDKICVGKLNLVDLAGSERQAKTGATGDRLQEATKINLSLSALGNVISALVDGKSQHIPYRDSKLTRLLQDSLGGNAKTVMIANCGPAGYNYNETLSTLRYANRAKNIKNKPKINEDPKDAKIREYQEKIKELREALAAQEKNSNLGGNGDSGSSIGPPQIVEKIVEKTIIKREGISEEELRKLEEDTQREKQELKARAQAEMKALLAEQTRTKEEKERLEKELEMKAQEKKQMSKQKKEILNALEQMEQKLISGGKVIDKAARQEKELREAQLKIEEQKRQEMILARELAEKEDSHLLIEEKYASLQEEVDDKTKKIKKLWAKHKATSTEMEDLKNEFQIEKEDMLETIRELTRQLKLVQVLIQNLIPFEHANNIEKRAKWDPETDEWKLEKLDSHPTSLKPKRPIGRYGARRSETEFARRNKMLDPTNVRWKVENVIQLELDMPERRTRDFENHMNYMLDRVGLNEDEPPIVYENDITQQQSFAKQTDPIGSSSGYGTGTGTDVDADAKHEKESTKKSSSKTSSSDSSFDSSNGAKSTKVKTKTSDELEEDLIDEDPTVVKKSSKRPASASRRRKQTM